jgi:predicted nucleic acid-binding protein
VTTDFVLDASTTITLYLEGEEAHLVVPVLNAMCNGSVVVPGIWSFEMSNILVTGVRRGRFSAAKAARLADDLSRLRLVHDERPVDIGELAAYGAANGLTGYDAAYLMTALRRGIALATNDRRLADAARAAGVPLIA